MKKLEHSQILDDEIKQLSAAVLKEGGVCLVEAELIAQRGRLIIRLLVDRICGGITIDECALLNSKIAEALERQDLIKSRYILEVSSPGVDRPLVSQEDFCRCLNRKARIIFAPGQQQSEITGVIKEVYAAAVSVDVEGEIREVPFEKIVKAKQII